MRSLPKPLLIGISGLLGAVIVMGAAVIVFRGAGGEAQARAIVEECAKTEGDRAACYERTVPDLYPSMSVSQVFDIVRTIRALDPSYQFCHVLGHKLGERVVADDPNTWVSAIPLNPVDGLCSNGFVHGVVGGRFRSEVLEDTTIEKFLPDFALACTAHSGWQPSNLDRAICYHGMGHLFVFITNADIQKALTLCDRITPSDYRRVCVQGVFMQIYQPLEPDDFAMIEQMPIKPTATTVRQYCAAFKDDPMAEGSCIGESWPLRQPHITDGTAVEALCRWSPNAEEMDACYMAMSSIVGRMTLGDASKAVAACNAFPAERRTTCFSYSAEAVLEEDRQAVEKAIALCERATGEAARSCMMLLADHAAFIFGQDTRGLKEFCAALPKDIGARCGPI